MNAFASLNLASTRIFPSKTLKNGLRGVFCFAASNQLDLITKSAVREDSRVNSYFVLIFCVLVDIQFHTCPLLALDDFFSN